MGRMDKAVVYLLPAKWSVFVEGLEPTRSAAEFNRDAGAVRPTGDGGLEEYVPAGPRPAPAKRTVSRPGPPATTPLSRALSALGEVEPAPDGDFDAALQELAAQGVELDRPRTRSERRKWRLATDHSPGSPGQGQPRCARREADRLHDAGGRSRRHCRPAGHPRRAGPAHEHPLVQEGRPDRPGPRRGERGVRHRRGVPARPWPSPFSGRTTPGPRSCWSGEPQQHHPCPHAPDASDVSGAERVHRQAGHLPGPARHPDRGEGGAQVHRPSGSRPGEGHRALPGDQEADQEGRRRGRGLRRVAVARSGTLASKRLTLPVLAPGDTH